MKTTNHHYHAVIIGGGVVGCTIARELSKYKVNVAVLEKEDDVGWGISCRNSGVVHAGFNNRSGTLMARLCVEGNKSFKELCHQLDVPYKKIGKLVVAKKKEEIEGLQKLKQQGDANGVNNLQIINLNEVKRLEPNIEGIAALYSSETAITSPYLLTIALAENALDNGVSFFLNTEVESITRLNNSRFKIITNNVTNIVEGKELFQKLEKICRRFLSIPIHHLGSLSADPKLIQSTRSQKIVMKQYPRAVISKEIKNISA